MVDDESEEDDKNKVSQFTGKKISAVKGDGSVTLKTTDDCTNSNSQNSGVNKGQKKEKKDDEPKSSVKIGQKKVVASSSNSTKKNSPKPQPQESKQTSKPQSKSKKEIEEFKESEVKFDESKEVLSPLKDYQNLRPLIDEKWDPIQDSPQNRNQRMPFSFLVKALHLIE